MSRNTLYIGLILGFGAIFLGNLLEGGHFQSLVQGTAALIVLGGTFGATLVGNSAEDIKRAWSLFWSPEDHDLDFDQSDLLGQVQSLSFKSREESISELEKRVGSFEDPFLRKMGRLVVDGVDPSLIRRVGEMDLNVREDQDLSAVKVWNEAGGYAPTIGIIGAVLGLIHVMANLTDTSMLGQGIAVAFVATIYGVAIANLVLLPIGSRLKKQIEGLYQFRERLLEAVVTIAEGQNALILQEQLGPTEKGGSTADQAKA